MYDGLNFPKAIKYEKAHQNEKVCHLKKETKIEKLKRMSWLDFPLSLILFHMKLLSVRQENLIPPLQFNRQQIPIAYFELRIETFRRREITWSIWLLNVTFSSRMRFKLFHYLSFVFSNQLFGSPICIIVNWQLNEFELRYRYFKIKISNLGNLISFSKVKCKTLSCIKS